MSSLLSHIEPVFGFFPLTALMVAGCLWGLFQLTIGMKCHPRLSQHFIFMGLCVITCFNFIHPIWFPTPDWEDFKQETFENEYQGATVTIDQYGITRLKHFRPDRNKYEVNYYDIGIATKSPDTIHVSTYAFFYKKTIRHIYYAGITVVLLYLILQVVRLESIRSGSNQESRKDGITLYSSPYNMPFSFAKYIFLPVNQPEENQRYILLHEESHIRHRHFYKLCLLLIITAFNWYNPFVWFLLAENKVCQEMEADGDVVRQGCIPTEYQMNLIRMAVQDKEWLWIRSSYNHHPLKKRILFMNDSINLKQSRIIIRLASLLFITATLFIMGCSSEVVMSSVKKDFFNSDGDDADTANVLAGSWYLKGTSRDTACTRLYPSTGDCYKFYGKNITMTLILYKNDYSGINAYYNVSGRNYKILSDSTVIESKTFLKYKLRGTDGMLLTSYNSFDKNIDPNSPTELWTRTTDLPEGVRKIFKSAVVESEKTNRFKGTWRLVSAMSESEKIPIPAEPDVYKIYGDDTYFMFKTIRFNKTNIDYSFEGHCGTFTYIADNRISEKGNVLKIEWIDDNNFYQTYFDGKETQYEKWTRSTLPVDHKQILKGIAPVVLH